MSISWFLDMSSTSTTASLSSGSTSSSFQLLWLTSLGHVLTHYAISLFVGVVSTKGLAMHSRRVNWVLPSFAHFKAWHCCLCDLPLLLVPSPPFVWLFLYTTCSFLFARVPKVRFAAEFSNKRPSGRWFGLPRGKG